MTENTTTDEYVYQYKSNNEETKDEINNNTINFNQHQTFIINEYSLIIGTNDNSSLYIECKKK